MHEPRSADALLPLKPVVFQILLTLAEGERHGYGIVQDIAGRTAARLRLRPGNLYRALDGMLELGLIEEAEPPSSAAGDERRRYYKITPFGRRVGAAEATRLRALVQHARAARLLKART